jgi:hypothetical protein
MSQTRIPYLKGDDRDQARTRAAELYTAGSSIRTVAREIGRSYGCTRSLLIQARVVFRARGGRLPKTAA